MNIDKISVVTPRNTGYAAAAGIGLATLSGISKNKTFRHYHKPLAWGSAVFTVLHIGLIEYYNYKFKNLQK